MKQFCFPDHFFCFARDIEKSVLLLSGFFFSSISEFRHPLRPVFESVKRRGCKVLIIFYKIESTHPGLECNLSVFCCAEAYLRFWHSACNRSFFDFQQRPDPADTVSRSFEALYIPGWK